MLHQLQRDVLLVSSTVAVNSALRMSCLILGEINIYFGSVQTSSQVENASDIQYKITIHSGQTSSNASFVSVLFFLSFVR